MFVSNGSDEVLAPSGAAQARHANPFPGYPAYSFIGVRAQFVRRRVQRGAAERGFLVLMSMIIGAPNGVLPGQVRPRAARYRSTRSVSARGEPGSCCRIDEAYVDFGAGRRPFWSMNIRIC